MLHRWIHQHKTGRSYLHGCMQHHHFVPVPPAKQLPKQPLQIFSLLGSWLLNPNRKHKTKTPKSEGKRGQKGAKFFLYVIHVSSTCSEGVFIPLTFFISFQKCSWSPGIFMEYSGCRVITWRRECTNCLLLLGHVSHAILKVMVAFGSNLRGRPSPSDIRLLPPPVWNSLRMHVTFAFQPSQHSSNSSSCA